MYNARIKEKWWFSQCGRTWLVCISQVLIPAEHLWCDFNADLEPKIHHQTPIAEHVDVSRAGCYTWTVGHCGGSEVKNYINTYLFISFLHRTIVSCLNVSSRATGFHLVLSVYIFFYSQSRGVPLTAIIWLTDCNVKNLCLCSTEETKSPTYWMPWG